MQETYHRTYVRVNKDVLADGTIVPLILYWNDKPFEITSFKKIGRRAAQLSGGVGILYMCMIEGRERKLYQEIMKDRERWFVEERVYA